MTKLTAGSKVRMIYRCRRCERANRPNAIRAFDYAVSPHGGLYDPNDVQRYPSLVDPICPTCKCECHGELVKARLVPDQKCGPKCVNAVGPSCDCSCRGANHGSHYTYHIEAEADSDTAPLVVPVSDSGIFKTERPRRARKVIDFDAAFPV